ncbi:hypothetical protein M231_02929 [Tremella mesenterica]|uniref:Uncharacterized protein n=1 Tax=Tremella mesenterica TaxID=5217 RepID=A0A4Q1BPB7_TREME|nr:hypothetical protein M231_02929 [Tremella mesenterica]
MTTHQPICPPMPVDQRPLPSPHSQLQGLWTQPAIPPVSPNGASYESNRPWITFTPSTPDIRVDLPPYITSSPPKYAPLPMVNEHAVLLAPPPHYHTPHCPHSANDPYGCSDAETGVGRCQCCRREGQSQKQLDLVVIVLVVLNVVVWGIVAYGYWAQWSEGTLGDFGQDWWGGSSSSGSGRACSGQDCDWGAFAGCEPS